MGGERKIAVQNAISIPSRHDVYPIKREGSMTSSTSLEEPCSCRDTDAASSMIVEGHSDAVALHEDSQPARRPSITTDHWDIESIAAASQQAPIDMEDFGFESDDVYGYGEASPDPRPRRRNSLDIVVPRRSSLKKSGLPRRASIQSGTEVQVVLPGQSKPIKKRRSITFDQNVKVKNVEALSRLTDRPEQLWFQDEEYERIRRNSWHLVEKIEAGKTGVGGRKYCVRGLEKLMQRDDILRTKNLAWDAVLTEQHLQREEGMFDEEYMSHMYKFSTIRSAKEAAARAEEDAKDIQNYLRSARPLSRRSSCYV